MVPPVSTTALTPRFPDFTAVQVVNLTVAPPQFSAFLGPNPAAKSTTITMLTGVLTRARTRLPRPQTPAPRHDASRRHPLPPLAPPRNRRPRPPPHRHHRPPPPHRQRLPRRTPPRSPPRPSPQPRPRRQTRYHP